jgi:hypothetical protein
MLNNNRTIRKNVSQDSSRQTGDVAIAKTCLGMNVELQNHRFDLHR